MIRWLHARLDEARVAMMFLTRLPMGRVERVLPIASTSWAWPVAGAVLGCVFALIHGAVIAAGFSSPVAIVLAMIAMLLASGGFHEDGLADLADGIGGGSDPARRLEIMRDSRLGSYGAMALVFLFLLSFVLWAEIDNIVGAAIAAGGISRMGLPLFNATFAPARSDGLGRSARSDLSSRLVVAALVVGGAISFGALTWLSAVLAMGACLGVQFAVCLYARRVLGGITGDVLGAAQTVGAVAVLLILGRV